MRKIIKKSIKLFLILGWLFTTIQARNIVSAQTETPPPPTPAPLFYPTVITTRPDISDLSCPEENPVGFGVKTPSPLWLQLCGSCLDGFGFQPTKVPLPTPTPEPTRINYKMYEMWGSPYQEVTPQSEWWDSDQQAIGPAHIGYTYSRYYGVQVNQTDSGLNYTGSFLFKVEGRHYGISDEGAGQSGSITLSLKNSYSFPTTCVFRSGSVTKKTSGNTTELHDWSNAEYTLPLSTTDLRLAIASGLAGETFDWEVDVALDCDFHGAYNGSAYYEFYLGVVTSIFYLHDYSLIDMHLFWDEIWAEEEEEEIPGYCDSIKAEGEAGSFEDIFGFGYTGFIIGQTYCAEVGPYDFNFLGLEFGIPYIAHACVQEIFLGDLNLLGMTVSLDLFTIVLAMAWVLRNLFTS